MSNGDSQPSALRFSKVLRRLVGQHDSRGIIRLVERWLEHGNVPQTARVTQAKAFMDLRLMDHAWVRLREAAKSDPGSVVVQLILAEMFVERGWPGKAAPLLDRIDLSEVDDDQRLVWSRVRTEASRPAKVPPNDAADIERSGTADEVLALAETYLSTGSLVRSESLLERLVRDGVDTPRIHDLLWAVRGDFSDPGMATHDLLDELACDDGPPELISIELTDSFVVDETAHIDPDGESVTGIGEATRRGFPKLFRRDEHTGETTAGTAGEVTASSQSLDDGGVPFDDGSTDPEGTPFPGSGDTRIMQVISHGDGVILQAVDGTIHRTTGDRNRFDLKSHRETYLPPDDETFLEDEDKDLIVMTRREDRPTPVLSSPRTQPAVALPTSKSTVLDEPISIESPPSIEESDGKTSGVEFDSVPPRGMPWSITVGSIGVMAFIAWMVFAVLHWIAQGQIIQETHQVVATADFRSLQELEARLEAQIRDERSPIAVRVAELALVRAILWADYTGDSTRMALAQDGLDSAKALDAPAQEVALVAGYLALAMGDLPTAREWLNALDLDDSLSRDLTARVALRVRDDEESRQLLTGIGASPESAPLLELLSRESLLTELGDEPEAEGMRVRLLQDHPNNPFVQIQRFQEQWDDGQELDVLASLDDVMESLPGPVSARQEGRLHALRASLLIERGEYEAAERSWASALVVDPTNPRYLHHAAAVRLSNNQVLAALDDLDRCLGARPWDQNCRHGKIQALLELDRITHARQAIDAWGVERTTVLRAWVQRAAGDPEGAITTLEDEDGALASWVRGMALLDLGSAKASVALEPAIEGWAGVSQPMTRILVGRAKVAQVVAAGDLDAMSESVVRWAEDDPVALVMVAQRLDDAGQRVSAERLFEKATELGPESAVALHAMGMFWFDPRSSLDSARSVWRQYLDLQPSGDRARRTRARMGRR